MESPQSGLLPRICPARAENFTGSCVILGHARKDPASQGENSTGTQCWEATLSNIYVSSFPHPMIDDLSVFTGTCEASKAHDHGCNGPTQEPLFGAHGNPNSS